jgi:hypothetical protein
MVSESRKLKNMESVADVNNANRLATNTKEAINNISIKTAGAPTSQAQTIIITGDIDSFASRLVKSYS